MFSFVALEVFLNMAGYYAVGLSAFFESFWRNRQLIMTLVGREVAGRYRGSLLGLAWAFLNPLVMLVVYTIVFGFFFGASWRGEGDSKVEYALGVYCGIIAFGVFAECVTRSTGLVLNNKNYVKKIVFPLEVMAWVVLVSAGVNYIIGFIFLILFSLFVMGGLGASVLWVPALMLPIFMGTLGVLWVVSALCVYLRDIKQVIGSFVTVMMFMSGIFYAIERLPQDYQFWLEFNPLATLIGQMRAALIQGHHADPGLFGLFLVGSFLMAWAGFVFFQKVRRGFADVL